MREDLQLVSEWLMANSLTLNIGKTYVIFSMCEVPNDLYRLKSAFRHRKTLLG